MLTRTWRPTLVAMALAYFFFSLSALADETMRERVGYAYAAGSGALIYTEHHQEWWKGDRILRDTVTYRDPEGGVIGEKHVDFRAGEDAPEFLLRNIRTGHSEGARAKSKQLEVSFKEGQDAPLKSEALSLPEGAIVDAGFDRFVENNWEALMRGDTFVRPFLIPSRLQFMDFRIRRVDDSSDPDRAIFEMAIDSPLLRLFAPSIKVAYQTRGRTLLEYDGISNMRNANGENLDVKIRFNPARSVVSAALQTVENAQLVQ
ncbi:MAG: hypothetical protein OER43_05940 [Gammaproteobacteria bacterium]|nr:hypothetical protein [Gammaproteobacteria bacterium]MDH3410891.1 hypothetical protein [Gammaproteobacteria bacterium]